MVAGIATVALLVYGLASSGPELKGPELGEMPTTSGEIPVPEWQIATIRVTSGLNELFMQPDPARTAEFVDPECKCFSDIRDRLSALAKEGHRYDGNTLEVVRSHVVQEIAAGELRVELGVRQPPTRRVDKNGQVVDTQPAADGVTNYVMRRGPEGQWRLLARVTPPGLTN